MSKTTSLAPETLAAQALHYVDLQKGAIIPPIQPSTTFLRDENYELLAPNCLLSPGSSIAHFVRSCNLRDSIAAENKKQIVVCASGGQQ